MRVGVTEDGSAVKDHKVIDTPKHFDEAIETFGSLVRSLSKGQAVAAMAGGITGSLDEKRKILTRSALEDWVGKPLAERLKQEFSCDVDLENDTAVVGLGEARFGAGKGSGIVAYITVSSGLGGVRVVNGAIDKKSQGFEPGHQIVDLQTGADIESFVSGKALTAKYGKIPSDITDDAVWQEEARLLAVGLYNTILHWSPDVLVLGGGVVLHTQLSLDLVASEIAKLPKIFPSLPQIKKAELGDIGGLYGGLAMLR